MSRALGASKSRPSQARAPLECNKKYVIGKPVLNPLKEPFLRFPTEHEQPFKESQPEEPLVKIEEPIVVWPLFIRNEYRIDIFLESAKNLLKEYITDHHSKNFNYLLKESIIHLKQAISAYKEIYKAIGTIIIEDASKKEMIKLKIDMFITQNVDNQNIKKLNIDFISKYLKDKEYELSRISETNYSKNLQVLKTNIMMMYENIYRCLEFLVTIDFNVAKSEDDDYLAMIDKKVKTYNINGIAFLKFIIFKNWLYDNIYFAFNDICKMSELNCPPDYNYSLVMPGVFYELFLQNNVSTGPNLDFHSNENKELIFEEINLISIENESFKINILKETNDQNITKYYLTFGDKKTEIFPNFQLKCRSNADPHYIIEAGNNKAIFYPKIGGTSQGFSVGFKNSNLRLFCKELYCVSECFYAKQRHQTELSYTENSTNNSQSSLEESGSIESKNSEHEDVVYTYSRHNRFEPKEGEYHINEYVELSGYYILENFGLTPKLDSFFSELYGKPMIVVNGIDPTKYSVVSIEDDDGNEIRYDFSNILNDPRAVFISAIKVQILRIIQFVFLIDDFHEGNLAVCVENKEYVDGDKTYEIEFIKSIQVFDLWPATQILGLDHVLKSSEIYKVEDAQFDDLIIHNLGIVECVYVMKMNEENQYIRHHLIEGKEMLKRTRSISKAPNSIYGDRIESFCKNNKNYRLIVTYYAMCDLFDEVYYKKHEMFSFLKTESFSLCARIGICLLKDSFEKMKKTLPSIPEIEEKDFSFESICHNKKDHFWIRYMCGVVDNIREIIKALTLIIEFVQNIKIDGIYLMTVKPSEGLSYTYTITNDVRFSDIKANFQRNFVGVAFSYDELPPNFDEEAQQIAKKFFDFDEASKQMTKLNQANIQVSTTNFYIIRSPVFYDIFLYQLLISHYLKSSAFKNCYIKPSNI